MPWRRFKGVKVPVRPPVTLKAKYSVTGDILSYLLCSRQYGFFAVRGYQPAHVVQIWFGTIVHQVLDKLHMHYQGLIDLRTKGQIPSDSDVEMYFNQVEDSLKARGVRAINEDVRRTALRVLRIFNRIEGNSLYPNVIDTECTLQATQPTYILHGVVDVLRDVSIGRKMKEYNAVEIWDYKGSRFPDINKSAGKNKLRRYTFQMMVYAELYKLKYGKYPLKGIIYFMNELDIKPEPTIRPTQAVYEIDFRNPLNMRQIAAAMKDFSSTVGQIDKCKQTDRWEPPTEEPDKETCDICDTRWNCPTVKKKYPMRYP